MIHKVCIMANVPRRKAYMFRYSWAGEVMQTGIPKSYARRQLGYTTNQMIEQVYGAYVEQSIQMQFAYQYSPADRL